MSPLWTLSLAMARGFVRDRMSLFFVVLFPLMFLVLFGGVFSDDEQARSSLLQVGDVPLLRSMDAPARAAFDEAFEVERTDDRAQALAEVRRGDADAAVEQRGDRVVLHFSQADRVQAATVRGTMSAFVQSANLAATGEPPTYHLQPRQVEDDSLETIQYFTPGLLGWAIAMSATFGAAMTLVQWRTTKLLRRLRLAPVPTRSVVGARIFVSVTVALVQLVIFVGVAMALFGLQLTGSWYMAVPLVVAATLAFMAIGLLTGAVAKTSDGASGLANLIILPMAFFSGTFLPLDVAPEWMHAVSLALPLRYLNEGMLDVMVRGAGPAAALLPIAILLGFAALVTLVATRVFRWEAH